VSLEADLGGALPGRRPYMSEPNIAVHSCKLVSGGMGSPSKVSLIPPCCASDTPVYT